MAMHLVCVLSAASGAAALESDAMMMRADEGTAARHEVFGRTVSGDGSALPGVLIALSGDGVNQKVVSDADGAFRFSSIPSGSYSVVFKIKGAKKVKREITVSTGDLDLGNITMK
jgi:hypothetical protein